MAVVKQFVSFHSVCAKKMHNFPLSRRNMVSRCYSHVEFVARSSARPAAMLLKQLIIDEVDDVSQ